MGGDVVIAGLPEGADDAARPGVRVGQPAGDGLGGGDPGRRYYFDWAKTAKGQAEQPPNSPFTPAVTLWRALDVALRLIEEEGLDGSSSVTRSSPAPRAESRRSAWSASARTTRMRTSSPPRASRIRSTALAAQADRDRYGGRRLGGRGAQGQDRPDRPLRLLRRLRHRDRPDGTRVLPCAISAPRWSPRGGGAPRGASSLRPAAPPNRLRRDERRPA